MEQSFGKKKANVDNQDAFRDGLAHFCFVPTGMLGAGH
jgi:hypothetical protein